MNKLIVPLLALATSAFVAAGCHTGGAYEPRNAAAYDVENHEKVALMDEMVQRSITIRWISAMPNYSINTSRSHVRCRGQSSSWLSCGRKG